MVDARYRSQWSVVGWVLRPGEWVYPIVLLSILFHSFSLMILHILVPRDRHPIGEFNYFVEAHLFEVYHCICMYVSTVYDYCFTWFPTYILWEHVRSMFLKFYFEINELEKSWLKVFILLSPWNCTEVFDADLSLWGKPPYSNVWNIWHYARLWMEWLYLQLLALMNL